MEEVLIGCATPPQSQHFTSRELKQHNPELYRTLFRFCIVRNPFDRLLSAYEYLLNGGNRRDNGNDVLWQKKLIALGSFNAFVMHYFTNGEPDWTASLLPSHFIPQYLFICTEEGVVDVDCCLPFEEFSSSGLSTLINQGHISVNNENGANQHCTVPPPALVGSPSIPHVRKGSDLRTSGYDAEGAVAELVYAAYKKDFELLGYDKESWRKWIKE